MIQITLKYGLSRSTQVTVNAGTTIRSAVTEPVKAILSLPENIQATINGDTVPFDTEVFEDSVVIFEKQAAGKA